MTVRTPRSTMLLTLCGTKSPPRYSLESTRPKLRIPVVLHGSLFAEGAAPSAGGASASPRASATPGNSGTRADWAHRPNARTESDVWVMARFKRRTVDDEG